MAKKTTAKKGKAPTKSEVAEELLAYWDADTPLDLAELRKSFANGNSLDDVGITSNEAEGYVNKYNSIIMRAGKGPVVKASEAKAWAKTKMLDIVAEVFARAQPQ